MILTVFRKKGDKLSIAAAYSQLISLYSHTLFPDKKAAGSLGGAVNGGTIILNSGYYTRVR